MRDDLKQQRISVARTQLESGLKPATVALRLQIRFAIGRTVAYEIIKDASNIIQASDDGPSEAESAEPVDSADLVNEILYDARRCLAAGDYANGCKLIAAADRVKRWGGQDGPDGPAWA